MAATPRRRAAGFTLIELLVVVSILAVLAALSVGAYFRIRAGQQQKMTEDTLSKLEGGLRILYTAELDNAKDAYSGKKTGYGQQVDLVKGVAVDQDRSLSLWTYFWMKNAFPQSFDDGLCPNLVQRAGTGTAPLNVPDLRKGAWLWSPAVTSNPAVLIIPQALIFQGVPNTTPTTAKEAAEQSAVLFHRLLSQKSGRGQTFDADASGALSAQIAVGGLTNRVFTDAHGNPVAFVRFAQTPEMAQPPYAKAGVASNDPLDSAGRLGVVPANWLGKPSAEASLGLTFGVVGSASPPVNWIPTTVARGKKPDWTGFPFGSTITQLPDDQLGMIYGYKLRRQGNGGDK